MLLERVQCPLSIGNIRRCYGKRLGNLYVINCKMPLDYPYLWAAVFSYWADMFKRGFCYIIELGIFTYFCHGINLGKLNSF